MLTRIRTVCLALAIVLVIEKDVAAVDLMTTKEGMSVVSMTETAGMTLRILNSIDPFVGQSVAVNGTYSESAWNLSMSGNLNGKPLTLNISGSLSGNIGSTITSTFSSTGSWGIDPLSTSGQTSWYYNASITDYDTMDYDDQGVLGSASKKWIVRGAEILAGAGIGGWIGGWAGALSGALAAWTISDIVYEIADTVTPPPPPRPPVPVLPPTPPPLYPVPSPGRDIKIINGSNNTVYNNNGNQTILNSNYNNGTINGTMSSIPEPSSVAMGLLSCLTLVYCCWWKKTLQTT